MGQKRDSAKILAIAESNGFSNATKDNPVDAVEFLYWLDVSCLEDLLNGLYSREPVYHPVAMLKAILLMDPKEVLHRTCQSSQVRAGYNIRQGSKISGMRSLPYCEVVSRAEIIGLSMGKDTVQDATPIKGCNHDDEAEYNAGSKRIQGRYPDKGQEYHYQRGLLE